jgi:thiol-disulfide isomerase/thioredoxin
MTLATTLLLAILTATNPSSDGGPSDPILLDFHADWCGPCQKMRPAVDQLSRKGYPVKSINIDRSHAVAERYGVQAVPTFVVVDRSGRELDRTSGLQPAASLERFYLAARAKAQPPDRAQADDAEAEDEAQPALPVRRASRQPTRDLDRDDDSDRDESDGRPQQRSDRPAKSFANPHPAETVVRIKVQGPHSTGFGSGTIIYSTPEMSIILTCAHIFKLEGRSKQVPPNQFPRQIILDLFDGQLHSQPSGPPKANYVESFPGRAVDYDFNLDVGLIVFRPGRQLPASRVVPPHWQPKSAPLPMKMLTVGCSEGNDATAWHTRILNPRMRGFLQGQPSYEAIECEFAPKQGRSGGGLFTTDGYIAGVCNFAEPQGNHGLYATPQSIYALLDRNNLSELYAPAVRGSGTLLADGGQPATRPRPGLTQVARSQSPDSDEPERRPAASVEKGDVLLPHYSLLGIKDPVGSDGDSAGPRPAASRTTKHVAWHPTHGEAPAQEPSAEASESQIETSSAAPAAETTSPKANPARPRWRPIDDTRIH